MSEMDLIQKLTAALKDSVQPAIPLSIALWDMGAIAAYMHRSPDSVRERIACLPSFPRPIRLPCSKKGQPLYKAKEVIAWTESHQE